eukprot:TRINITY_DN2254_c0_g2_i1.p3 TRINITY_DN2254_c0_g2~~TRINITY_DN2254_c0_g2_i1.p3  ORF type:complete len:231 (+),score=74.78 TRINITY_DN2254_c0_g2_i1:1410-2102(+)
MKVREKRETNKMELERLKEQQTVWEEEERQEKEQRRGDQQAMLQAYREYKMQDPEKVTSSKQLSLNTSGNFFFKSGSITELMGQEQQERQARREAALVVQRENQSLVERKRSNKRVTQSLKRTTDKKRFDKSVRKSMEMDRKDEEEKRSVRMQLRETWDRQVQEKKGVHQKEVDERRQKAATLHAWRNESSDEEYLDFADARKHPKASLFSPSSRQGLSSSASPVLHTVG